MAGKSDTLKVPPHDLDAEKSVLGAILIDPSAINLVVEIIRPEHFYLEEHRLIFSSMLSLFEKHQPIDVITLSAELKQKGNLKKIGGASYLSELIETVPTSAYVEHYARIVKNLFIKRSLISFSSRLIEKAFDEQTDIKKILDEAETSIFSLSQAYLHQDFVHLKDILAESFARLEELTKKGIHLRGLPTGFSDLDAKLAGMQESNLLILAARPAIGKTTFALNIALYVATQFKAPVGIFSLEMSKEELVDRLLVGQADIDAWRLKTGRLSDDDYQRITEAMGELSEAPIYIDDTPGASVLEMRTKARKLKIEKGLKLLIVDYLQLVDPGRRFDNRVQEVSFVSQNLKNLARELKIPVLAISQLSRAVEHRGEKKPQLADLRESGCITGDCLIMRADTGELLQIADLAKGKVELPIPVYSLDENWKLVIKNLVKAFSSGKKMVYELETRTGRKIKASGNHKFITVSGWKRLDELKIGDYIALPRIYNHFSRNSVLSDNELILLAHLLGDGCTLPRQPVHYTSSDLENIRAVKKAAKELFGIEGRIVRQKNWYHLYLPSPYHLGQNKHHPIFDWYRKLGIDFCHSFEKKIPPAVFCQSNEKIALFLRHLWSTDGSILPKKIKKRKPAATIYYSSTSYSLILQVQHLLLRLGILSTIRKSTKKGYRPNWQVHVFGAENQINFLTKIGCFGKRGRIIPSLLKALEKIAGNPNLDIVPKEAWKEFVYPAKEKEGISWREFAQRLKMEYCGSSLFKNAIGRKRLKKIAKILNDLKLKALAESDVYWDRIVSIRPLGVEEVYDATVEETHNFVANDIIIHNSIEQDADVVMFLYNEEESEDLLDQNKRLVKLLVAKHRNGPTGEIDLMFRTDRVRFYSVEKGK